MWYKTSQSDLCSRRQNGQTRTAYGILQYIDLHVNENGRVSIQAGMLFPYRKDFKMQASLIFHLHADSRA